MVDDVLCEVPRTSLTSGKVARVMGWSMEPSERIVWIPKSSLASDKAAGVVGKSMDPSGGLSWNSIITPEGIIHLDYVHMHIYTLT